MENVVLFMYGLMDDPSLLVQKVCDEVKLSYKKDTEMRFLHLLLKTLHKERPDAPINPLYNEWVCWMNHYLPQPYTSSQLYYFNGFMNRIWKESFTTIKRHDGDVKPCVIYMEWAKHKYLHRLLHHLLQTCDKLNQPVQYLYLYAGYNDREIPREETSQMDPPLRFAEKAHVELRWCDFSTRSLQPIAHSMQLCTTLENLTLNQCSNLPLELFTALGRMIELKHLDVNEGSIKTELIQEMTSQIKHLQYLQYFTLAQIDVIDVVAMLLSLTACPLRELALQRVSLTGDSVMFARIQMQVSVIWKN